MNNALERIKALRAKAEKKQEEVDNCQGHLWERQESKIQSPEGDSEVCILCGERRPTNGR